MMKTCTGCGCTKPLIDFPPDKVNRDGRKGKCRACVLQRQRELRAEHPEKERAWVSANKGRVLASKRAYRERNADVLRVKNRLRQRDRRTTEEGAQRARDIASAYGRAHRRELTERNRQKRAEDPTRFQAREAVNRAVSTGRLVKPTKCSECGKDAPTQGHHVSYERNKWLDVIWLCARCHRKAHRCDAVPNHFADARVRVADGKVELQ